MEVLKFISDYWTLTLLPIVIASGILLEKHLVETRYKELDEKLAELKSRMFDAECNIQNARGDCRILPIDADHNWSHSIHVTEVVKMLMEKEGLKLYKAQTQNWPHKLRKEKKAP